MARSPRWLLVLTLINLMISAPAFAGAGEYVELEAIPNFSFGTWAAGDGNQSRSNVHCAASANWENAFTLGHPSLLTMKPPPAPLPYNFRVEGRLDSGTFYLYLNGDHNMTGSSRIQVSLSHRDIRIGTSYETLVDRIYDTHSHVGLFRDCMNGDNSELQVSILSSQLESARAGSYSGDFRAQIRGGTSGTQGSSQRDFSVTITISNVVKISNLNNINLGTWSGGAALSQQETFCVYSSNSSGNYQLTISSSNQDAGGNFRLFNTTRTRTVPYSLQFIDSIATPGGTTVGLSALSGRGSNSSLTCNGTDNAKLTLTVTQANLNASYSGNYSDTVVVRVAPI